MKRTFLTLLILLLPAQAFGQANKDSDPAAYFPTPVGWQWTYHLRISVGTETKEILYTTRVIKMEQLKGVGMCAVLASRSAQQLFCTNWYLVDEQRVQNPKRRQLGQVALFPSRILLQRDALELLFNPKKPEQKTPLGGEKTKTTPPKTPKKTGPPPKPPPKLVWSWASKDGKSQGTVTLMGREHLSLRNIGYKSCVVIIDRGTFKAGKRVRIQERKVWLARDYGVVKEVMEVRKETDEVTVKTEAHLTRLERGEEDE